MWTCLLLVAWSLVVVAEPPGPQYGAPASQYGPPRPHGPGQGHQAAPYGGNDESELANYEFKYDVDAPEYGTKFGHQEARQGDVATGRYHVLLPDGRTQLVEYTADQDGYRPKISYQDGGDGGGYHRGPQGGYNG